MPKSSLQILKVNISTTLNFIVQVKKKSLVSELIKRMELSNEQNQLMIKVISTLLNNTYYGILLGLDGSASIGGNQTNYQIYDDERNLISDCGEIEAEAWEAFIED